MQENNVSRKTTEKFIDEIPREIFREKFVGSICQTKEFSYIVAFWAKNTPTNYKKRFREKLLNLGIPSNLLESDYDLDNIATAIMDRAVELR